MFTKSIILVTVTSDAQYLWVILAGWQSPQNGGLSRDRPRSRDRFQDFDRNRSRFRNLSRIHIDISRSSCRLRYKDGLPRRNDCYLHIHRSLQNIDWIGCDSSSDILSGRKCTARLTKSKSIQRGPYVLSHLDEARFVTLPSFWLFWISKIHRKLSENQKTRPQIGYFSSILKFDIFDQIFSANHLQYVFRLNNLITTIHNASLYLAIT